ncbi:MAG: hypothetical protein JXB42_11740 [Deltaproteobacteria bacterium]|nr:hypothetical protein [Deltaproteobacteria bacterium]
MAQMEHSFATPAPAGLAALAVAAFGFAAVFFGKVGLGGLPLLAAWLIGGGIVQFTTAVIELKDHNITGGNVFLFFAAFFMFAAALSTLAKFGMIIFKIQPLPLVEGYMWMAGATFLTLVTPAYIRSSSLFFVALIVADAILWCICLLDMGIIDPKAWKPVVGYLLLFLGCAGLYLSGATLCNTVFGRAIYPVPKPLVK